MNPITEHKYNLARYGAAWILLAGTYAAVFGVLAGLPALWAALDGVVYAGVTGFEVLILWNILKYGTEGISRPLLTGVFYLAVGILFVAVAVGTEVAVALLLPTEIPVAFAATIPARALCTAGVYAFFALWYRFAARSDDKARRTEKMAAPPADSPASEAQERLERITVRGGGGKIEVIAVGEIIYLQAEGDYVAIVTSAGRHLKEGTMKSFEESLPTGEFVRVHRSYIVSVAHISRIETSGRDHTLILRGVGGSLSGVRIRISDAGYRQLRQTLGL